MIKKVLVMLMLVAMAVSIGCGKSDREKKKERLDSKLMDAPEIVKIVKSEDVTVDIYIDATYSMSGYINYPHGTIYEEAVNAIEMAAKKVENWNHESINYFKFGDEIKKIDRQKEFLEFKKPEFYNLTGTSLQHVLSAVKPDHVSVVVTDFFQTDQDFNSIMSSSKINCFGDEGQAVVVIGMKGQFDGDIYDIGKSKGHLSYKTSDNPESYRPFYFIVTGRENDVKEFTRTYQKTMTKGDVTFVNFSHNLGYLTEFEVAPMKRDKDEKNRYAQMAKLTGLIQDNKIVPQLRMKLDEKKSGVRLNIECESLMGNIPNEYTLDNFKVEKWEKGNYVNVDVDAKKFVDFKLEDISIKDNKFNALAEFRFTTKELRGKAGKYRMKFSLVPNKQEYLDISNVFADWNFDDDKVFTNADAKEVGTKTLKISDSINVLGNFSYNKVKPGFHDFYIYFELK